MLFYFLGYPICTSSCKESNGCECPFSITHGNYGDTSIPYVNRLNNTCTCTANLIDRWCLADG